MKTIYLNLEDDVAKTAAKIRAYSHEDVLLVIPKDSYLLGDSINLRLLKKQVDLIGNKVFILTMDPTGQMYAREAGFLLKKLPRVAPSQSFSDIRPVQDSAPVSILTPAEFSKRNSDGERVVVKKTSNSSMAKKTTTRVVTQSPLVSTTKIYKERPVTTKKRVREEVTAEPARSNVFMPPESTKDQLPRKKSHTKLIFGFVAITLVVVVALVTVILPNSTVTIYAKAQSVSRDLEINFNSNIEQIDSDRLILPATLVTESKDVSDSFTVNGRKEVGAKAQGRVALYNLTGSPLNLKSTTTILTVGSKSYYFTQDLTGIVALESPNKDNNATVADVVAGDGGEDFNLPAGTRMEINNQTFGSQPQRLYAKTITQVIGGSSRFISVVSDDDITTSQKQLIKSAVDQINQNLPEGRKLVEGAYTVTVENYLNDKPVGTEITSFVASATIKITGLAFNQDDLKNVVRGRLQQSLGSDKLLQDSSLDTIVNKIKVSDFTAGTMQLSVHYESKALPSFDEQSIISQIAGKSKDQASDFLLTNPDIEKVDLTLAPSWQKSLPRLSGKIHLEIIR